MPKPQILFIHGGMTFKTKKDYLNFLKKRPISIEKKIKWHQDFLDKELGKKFEIIRPQMPLKENATYQEWAIHLERFFPYLRHDLILIGTSLGGIFLAKYLSEYKFPKRLLSVYLVCTPFDGYTPGEDLVNGFALKYDLSLLEKNTKNLYLLFSEKDDVVPVEQAEKYRAKLKKAKIIIYKNIKGHFQVAKFPEIVKLIKSDLKK
ncbi:MAG: serine hydrolase [Patescibacteria group bacterium]|nr:serine hydrolase [Patescibacteria group bacterium]MDQ5970833.1 serine hydrolase [Patescibacteria group bacterium]